MNENSCSNQKIHVLFEHGFKLYNTSNKPPVINMTLYAEGAADQTDHFAVAFVCENVAHDNFMTFKSLQLPPFCLEKFSVRKGIF